MDENQKNFFRCACCNMKFDSSAECHQHFESYQHKCVAVMAWIRAVAEMNRGTYEDTKKGEGRL